MNNHTHIINYGMGNIHSIKKQINHLGYEVNICNSPQEIEQAEKIILPGVGHFAKAMDFLKEKNFLNALNNFALNQKKPILGICLGMQLMTKISRNNSFVIHHPTSIAKFRYITPQKTSLPNVRNYRIHRLYKKIN